VDAGAKVNQQIIAQIAVAALWAARWDRCKPIGAALPTGKRLQRWLQEKVWKDQRTA